MDKISNEQYLNVFIIIIVSTFIIWSIILLLDKFFIKKDKQKYWKTLYYKYYHDTNKLLEIIREKQITLLEIICKPKRSFLKELKYHKKALRKIYKKDYKNRRYLIWLQKLEKVYIVLIVIPEIKNKYPIIIIILSMTLVNVQWKW